MSARVSCSSSEGEVKRGRDEGEGWEDLVVVMVALLRGVARGVSLNGVSSMERDEEAIADMLPRS